MNKVPFNLDQAKAGRKIYLRSADVLIGLKGTLDHVAQIVSIETGSSLVAFSELYHKSDDGWERPKVRTLSSAERDRLYNLTLDQRKAAATFITQAGGEDHAGCLRFNAEPAYYTTKQPTDFFLTYPEDSIAAGWNPHRVTISQIGDGYRLLTTDEWAGPQRQDVEYWQPDHKCWEVIACRSSTHSLDDTYRTNRQPGEYTPKKKRVPKTLDDLPSTVFFLKNTKGTISSGFFSSVIEAYIRDEVTYSTSLHGPWLPFWKEVEG